ncbi:MULTISPECIES: helix-turn-helix domain-containing protein [unclassified Companilactobacillus]|jgi:transcriptional regulator with XRE-family HTH domain|uniref:helix-turn-helix domain-containing protein n=1 Tax=unclassified Companilactobacillus TaxID=2767904 RepID=UPI002FF379DD
MITIGKYLRTKRLLKKLTLQQVVDQTRSVYNCSTSTSVLSAIETDKNKIIDGELLFVLSDLYGIKLEELQRLIIRNLQTELE